MKKLGMPSVSNFDAMSLQNKYLHSICRDFIWKKARKNFTVTAI